nr:unnamed protein product [Digitaria exilis]
MATALPATAAASCRLQLSRRRLPGTSPSLSPPRGSTFRCHGGSSVACSCSPGPPPAVPGERRGGVAGQAKSPEGTVRIVAVVGEGTISPIKDTPWEEVMRHTADRLKWVDEGFEMLVFTDNSIEKDDIRKDRLHVY